MRLSPKGLDLIKEAEGYHTKQPDGSCKAYLCPAGVWTVGHGCTSGVGPLTHWSAEEATEHLREEMREHEKNVEGVVKVPLTQGQFDALVSLSYNIGIGNLKKSTLLRELNAGDYAGAASHFMDFKKARVSGVTAKRMKLADGTLATLPGLVTRRAAEAALFLEAEPNDPMPQAVSAPAYKYKFGDAMKWIGVPATLASGGTGAGLGLMSVPSVPDLSQLVAARSAIETAGQLTQWLVANWQWAGICVGAYLVVCHVSPMIAEKMK